jgi:ribonuclease D
MRIVAYSFLDVSWLIYIYDRMKRENAPEGPDDAKEDVVRARAGERIDVLYEQMIIRITGQ